MYCRVCKCEVEISDKYCSNCGNDLRHQKEVDPEPKFNGIADSSDEYRLKAITEFTNEQLIELKKCTKCQWYNFNKPFSCENFRKKANCFERHNSYRTLLEQCHTLYLFLISFLIVFILVGNRAELSLSNMAFCLVIFFVLFLFNIMSTKFFEGLSSLFNKSTNIIHYIIYFISLFMIMKILL